MTIDKKLNHLYWRAEFGIAPEDLKNIPSSTKKAVEEIFERAKKKNLLKNTEGDTPSLAEIAKLSKEEKQARLKEAREDVRSLNVQWIKQMAKNSSLREKMTLFWHGHFACELKRPLFATQQVNTLKKHALGNFKDLVLAIAKDAAMILYLNNQQNRKSQPNENFARELLELFTMGRGNYTEQDIKEAARAFTGWFTNRLTGEFQFRERAHDNGKKTFMGKTGNFDGIDIIEIILAQKQTAHFIAQKVYRFFVNETNINNAHVEELATVFFNSAYDIEQLMRHLFMQEWFYADENIGVKIKSPIEFLVGTMRTLHLDFEDENGVLFTQQALGQVLFRPPNVAGWAGGKSWIDNATLLVRLNYASYIFNQADVQIQLKEAPETRTVRIGRKIDVQANLNPLVSQFKNVSQNQLSEVLSSYLLLCPVQMKDSAFEKYASYANKQNDRIKAWIVSLMSMPEYQLC